MFQLTEFDNADGRQPDIGESCAVNGNVESSFT